MEKCGKPSSSVNNSENGNSKKYKFYRKPSIKKKAPEVKQTKTSLARLLKANPLLKYDKNPKHGLPSNASNTDLKLNPVNSEVPKLSITNLSGNGPCLRPKVNSLSRCRLSSSDFNKPILSSTRIDADEVFVKPLEQKPIKIQPEASGSKEKQTNYNESVNNKKNNVKRKSLSRQHLDKKKKELQEITRLGTVKNSMNFAKNGLKSLKRSLSMDSCSKKGCYRIEEESSELLAESQSLQNLSQIKKVPDIAVHHRSVLTTLPSLGELQKRLDDWCLKNKNGLTNHCLEYDEENKENIEVEIIESNSYEDLRIPNDKH